MRHLTGLALLLPLLCWAGPHDYFECTAADGATTFSVKPCARGEAQRRLADATPAESRRLGEAGGLIRLEGSRGGHFYATVRINGVPLRVLVDTGATSVAISPSGARRIGLDPRRGVPLKSHTANGTVSALGVTLDSVELRGHTVHNISGVLMPQELGGQIDVLLGMAFLKHFEVNTDGQLMTLRRK